MAVHYGCGLQLWIVAEMYQSIIQFRTPSFLPPMDLLAKYYGSRTTEFQTYGGGPDWRAGIAAAPSLKIIFPPLTKLILAKHITAQNSTFATSNILIPVGTFISMVAGQLRCVFIHFDCCEYLSSLASGWGAVAERVRQSVANPGKINNVPIRILRSRYYCGFEWRNIAR